VRLGYDVTGGEDIVSAAKGICGTSIANIEPNRSSEKKKKTSLPGISNWLEFQWPVEGEYAGYLCARSLPNFGKWKNFSPAIIQKQWIIKYKKNLLQYYLITPFQILNG